MRHHRPAALLLIGALTIALMSGCGGSKPSNTSASSASAYVDTLCTSVSGWLRDIQLRAGRLEVQLGPSSSPQLGKQALEGFVAVSVADTQSVVSRLRAAGVPSVANGRKISSLLIAAFEHAKSKLQSLQSKASRLSVTSAATFAPSARRIIADAQVSLTGIGAGLGPVSSPELTKAAAKSTICRSVGARPASR